MSIFPTRHFSPVRFEAEPGAARQSTASSPDGSCGPRQAQSTNSTRRGNAVISAALCSGRTVTGALRVSHSRNGGCGDRCPQSPRFFGIIDESDRIVKVVHADQSLRENRLNAKDSDNNGGELAAVFRKTRGHARAVPAFC